LGSKTDVDSYFNCHKKVYCKMYLLVVFHNFSNRVH